MVEHEEYFEYEGFLGKMKAKGKGALLLSAAAAVLLVGGGVYLATKNKEFIEHSAQIASKAVKYLKYQA